MSKRELVTGLLLLAVTLMWFVSCTRNTGPANYKTTKEKIIDSKCHRTKSLFLNV